MKILVTGGAGFIGSHLVDLLVAHRHEVTVLDNLDPQVHGPGAAEPRHLKGHLATSAVRFVRGDVTDPEAVAKGLEGVEAVVHLAAAVGVGQSMYRPFYYVNANSQGTGLLLEHLVGARDRVRKLVVASSMSLYGEGAYRCPGCGASSPQERDEAQLASARWEVLCQACGNEMQPVPTPESKPASIASIYAATKKHQEDLFISFGRAYGIPTFALRFFNVFGPRQSLSNPYTGVAAIFLSRLLAGQPPLIFEDGQQSRDFVQVRDVAVAILLATESAVSGQYVLNIGTGKATTVGDVAVALASELGVEVRPTLLNQYRTGDIRHCIADTAQARRVLGFTARYSFADGLAPLIGWCRNETFRDAVAASVEELKDRGLVR